MEMAEQFAGAYELGMGDKARTPKKRGDKNKGEKDKGRDNNPKGRNKDGASGNPDAENPKMKPCVWCNKLHYLNKCPTLPEEMKK